MSMFFISTISCLKLFYGERIILFLYLLIKHSDPFSINLILHLPFQGAQILYEPRTISSIDDPIYISPVLPIYGLVQHTF